MKDMMRPVSLLIPIAGIACIVIWIWIPNRFDAITRTKVGYTKQEMRTLATALDGFALNEVSAESEKPFWGPLKPDLLERMKLPPNEFIDPYNLDDSESPRQATGHYEDDRAGVTLRGGDLQFYTDGAKFWMLVGRGPNGKLDLTPNAIEKAASYASDFRAMDVEMAPFTYDPSNGTVSAGDIWRAFEP